MPTAEYEEVNEPVEQLRQNTQAYQQNEKVLGVNQEVHKQYKPKQQAVEQNIQQMTEAYKSEAPQEVRDQHRKKVVKSVKDADAYISEERRKQERILEQFRAELDAITKIVAMIHEDQKTMQAEQQQDKQVMMQNFSPEAITKCIMAGMKFVQEAKQNEKAVYQNPTLANVGLFTATRNSVNSVYNSIVSAPKRLRDAIKRKVYSEVDKGVQKIGSVFDKGIAYLSTQKAAFLNLSPLEKERIQKREEAEAKAKEAEQKKPEEKTEAKAEVKEESKKAEQPSQEVKPEGPQKQEEQKKEPGIWEKIANSKATAFEPTERLQQAVKQIVDEALKADKTPQEVQKAFSNFKIQAIARADEKDLPKENVPFSGKDFMEGKTLSAVGYLVQTAGVRGAKELATAMQTAAEVHLQSLGKNMAQESEKTR